MDENLATKLALLTEAANNLANSLVDDLKAGRKISDDTVLRLSDYRKVEVDLQSVLDILNGVN